MLFLWFVAPLSMDLERLARYSEKKESLLCIKVRVPHHRCGNDALYSFTNTEDLTVFFPNK